MIEPAAFIIGDSYTLNPTKQKKYITDEVVESCKAFPNRPIPLAGGALVDKSYLEKIQKQATKENAELQIHFRHRERGRKETPKGWSYWYKGEVFATLGDLHVPGQEAQRSPTVAEPKEGIVQSLSKPQKFSEMWHEPLPEKKLDELAQKITDRAKKGGKSLWITMETLKLREDMHPTVKAGLTQRLEAIEAAVLKRKSEADELDL